MSAPSPSSIRRRWAAVVVVAGTILVLSLVPSPGTDPSIDIAAADKAAHAVGYAVLGLLVVRALAADGRLWSERRPAHDTRGPIAVAVGTVVVVALYGAGIEILQTTVPGRTFETADILANAVGATVAVGLWTGSARRSGGSTDRRSGDAGE